MRTTPAWCPMPFFLASCCLHAGAILLVIVEPTHWRWAVAALFVNQAAIFAAGMLPRCALLGPNLVRLPEIYRLRAEVALTFDDGPDPEVTPGILTILASHGVQATFFCIGEKAAAHPDICRNIVTQGHRIENHGQRHRNRLALSGFSGWKREIGDAQATLETITGRRPQFFRPLAGLRNPFLDPVLHGFGIRLASWSRRGYDTRCGDANKVLSRLSRGLTAGDILLLHDGNSARTQDGSPVIYQVLPRLLKELAARKLKPVPLNLS